MVIVEADEEAEGGVGQVCARDGDAAVVRNDGFSHGVWEIVLTDQIHLFVGRVLVGGQKKGWVGDAYPCRGYATDSNLWFITLNQQNYIMTNSGYCRLTRNNFT